ncbi:Y-family DNA polymerase [Bacillus sp. Bva_UNVM-123]|uniref:Y-family DNA polymerase n=1 Tax=Bacillus sp. Bva_UNVM-123 TaxID=2829798 RepID=UPI00391F5BA4
MIFDLKNLPKRDILCIDMTAFFASVECVMRGLDPLTTYLVVIGKKDQPGSVVLAASPSVKRDFRIKTTNRLFEIPNDPRIIIVEPRMKLYLEQNRAIQNIYRRYVSNDDLHIYSIDESFLDCTSSRRLFGDKFTIAKQIQKEICEELGLIAKIGIGDNLLLSKLALDNASKKTKDGIAYWSYENVQETIWKIPNLTDMWGIGSRTARTLNSMGIFSVKSLANCDVKLLKKKLGVIGEQLYYHAWGVDFSRISKRVPPKENSYGRSQILLRDYEDPYEVETIIREMVEDVAARLRRNNVVGGVVHLGIGYSKAEYEKGFSHQLKLMSPTSQTKEITDVCLRIFRTYYTGQVVRQVNVSVGKVLSKYDMQLNLFMDTDEMRKQEALDNTIDTIRNKFGKAAILRAASYTKGGTAKQRAGMIGGHKQ